MVDTGSTRQLVQRIVALESVRLIRQSFTLTLERSYTPSRPRSLIDLVAELTGGVDINLDTFILNNKLTGSEIIEIPAGRTVKYVLSG